MSRQEPVDETKETFGKTAVSSDIDQLCHLIDESTFGRLGGSSLNQSSCLSLRFRSVPLSHVKAFRSSRLKRLHPSSPSKTNEENPCRVLIPQTRRTFSVRFSLSSSSLLNQFRSLSTSRFPQTRRFSHLSNNVRTPSIRHSSPTTITLFRTNSILPTITEEESNIDQSLPTQSQLSCTIVDTRRPTVNSCNVEELAAYLDNFLYLPKSLSGAAELMYT